MTTLIHLWKRKVTSLDEGAKDWLRIGIFFLAGVFFALTTQAAPLDGIESIEVRVLANATVQGDEYRLGEIAELDGFDVDAISRLANLRIGKSPLPGRSLPLSLGSLSARLNHELKPNQYKIRLPKDAKVTRAFTVVKKDEIEKRLKETILAGYSQGTQAQVEIKSKLKDEFLPPGEITFAFERVGESGRLGGFASWKVKLLSQGQEHKQILVRTQVEVVDEVVVAKGQIKKGETIQESDLQTVKKDISNEKVGYQPEPDQVVGQQAKRDIQKMEALKPTLVEEPLIVEKGAPLKIVYKTENLYFENLGIAMKSARRGELIPVRTLTNKSTVYAIVKDGKTAEIAL